MSVTVPSGTVVTVSGIVNAKIAAPTGPFLVTNATATSTASNPLIAPLFARVGLSVRNLSATITVYVGRTAAVTADTSATGGWEVGPGESFNLDLDASNVFYVITPAATTALIQILEIASV